MVLSIKLFLNQSVDDYGWLGGGQESDWGCRKRCMKEKYKMLLSFLFWLSTHNRSHVENMSPVFILEAFGVHQLHISVPLVLFSLWSPVPIWSPKFFSSSHLISLVTLQKVKIIWNKGDKQIQGKRKNRSCPRLTWFLNIH